MSQDEFDDMPSLPPRQRRAESTREFRQSEPYPSVCMVAFILDIIMCLLRLAMAGLGIIGYAALKQQGSPLLKTAGFEIFFGFAIGILGIAAAGLMLARIRPAAFLGWGVVLLVVGSCVVGVWQASIGADLQPAGSPERIGFFVGAAFSLLVRLGLLGFYGYAVSKFSQWADRNS